MTDAEKVNAQRDEAVSAILMDWKGDLSLPTIRAALSLAYTQGRIDEVAHRIERMTQERAE